MNKILEGAKEALAFARGEGPAARITAADGGPYIQGESRPLIQHKHPAGGYIVWNWDHARWDKVQERVQIAGAK